MADRVLFQDTDDLSEQNLTEQRALSNLTDYVERGLGFSADYQANTLDIGSGHAIVRDGMQAYDVFPDARSGLGLASTTGLNYVYLAIQPGTDDDVRYEIESSQTPPSDPSLLVGTVDAGADTSTTSNRAPDGEFQEVSAKNLSNIKLVGPNGYDSLQAAHDALPAGGGKILLTKSISETDVVFTKKVHLEGVQAQTDPFDSGDDDGPFISTSGGDGIWFKRAGTLRDVTIVGSGGTGTEYCLRLGESGVVNISMTVDNVAVWNASGDNVQVRGGCQQWHLNFNEITSAGNDNFVVQTDLGESDYFNGNRCVLRHTSQAGRDGIRIEGPANGNSFFHVSESNGEVGFRAVNGYSFEGNQLMGYGAEANGTVGYDFSGVDDTSRGNTLNVFFGQSNSDPYNKPIFNTLNIARLSEGVWPTTTVRVRKGTPQNITTGGPNTVSFPSALRDNLGEWDETNNQFVPEKTSDYQITFNVMLEASADQNQVDVRFIDDGAVQSEWLWILNGAAFQSRSFTDTLRIPSGTPLQIEMEPVQADDTISGNGLRTNLSINDAR
ncbi:hypothetical protein NDI56_03920 [Haloarcula sp. S1CR25-12]|uniref:Right-handed parallel beta-helix repeat-containing protein n=1 Tax=Haloarcula saliterrae TaxID=2950534 RepID=A0ABU2F9H2_9EURY|nr:hypothetical protein [Haloarcula sp. S1CR25-12]MDS0258558.1 hypothetical protein [Haloarcula sp. S1CR25-12]